MNLAIICFSISMTTLAAAETGTYINGPARGKMTGATAPLLDAEGNPPFLTGTPPDLPESTDVVFPEYEMLPPSAAPVADIDGIETELTPEQRQAALERKIRRLERERYRLQYPAPGETFEDAQMRIKKLDATLKKLNRVVAEKQGLH